jgi:hypothetical protein
MTVSLVKAISMWCESGITQGTRLRRVQSLSDVRDQIGRVLDADGQPDRGIGNARFFGGCRLERRMGHARG